MTHLEIYNSLSIIQKKLDDWYDENCIGTKDTINSLYSCIINNSREIIYDSMDILENHELFCLSCFHLNLSTTRKAIYRYINIETELEDYDLLKEIKNTINEICIGIKKTEDKTAKACEKIMNTAYRTLNNLN